MSPLDRRKWWGYVEQIAGGALIAAALILIGLGIAHAYGKHPSDNWAIEAIALVVLAAIVSAIGLVQRMRRRREDVAAGTAAAAGAAAAGRAAAASAAQGKPAAGAQPPGWEGSIQVIDPGVLLFLLAPDPPGDDPQRLVRELGPVSCYVSDPSGAGQRALDTSVARVRGLLMVRWHPSFFGPVPDAVNGTYAYRWDEQRPDGSWRLLATAYVEVDLAAAPTEPAGGDPTAGGDGSSAVGT